jgi:hypothetical protein
MWSNLVPGLHVAVDEKIGHDKIEVARNRPPYVSRSVTPIPTLSVPVPDLTLFIILFPNGRYPYTYFE